MGAKYSKFCSKKVYKSWKSASNITIFGEKLCLNKYLWIMYKKHQFFLLLLTYCWFNVRNRHFHKIFSVQNMHIPMGGQKMEKSIYRPVSRSICFSNVIRYLCSKFHALFTICTIFLPISLTNTTFEYIKHYVKLYFAYRRSYKLIKEDFCYNSIFSSLIFFLYYIYAEKHYFCWVIICEWNSFT